MKNIHKQHAMKSRLFHVIALQSNMTNSNPHVTKNMMVNLIDATTIIIHTETLNLSLSDNTSSTKAFDAFSISIVNVSVLFR